MISRYKSVFAALVAVLAVCIVSVASASAALPEFKKTVNNKKVTLTGGSDVTFTNVAGESYGCVGSSGEGEITGAKTATVALKWQRCAAGSKSCTTSGDEAGEITTGSLPAELVYLSKEKHEVGLVVNYDETAFASWVCGGIAHGIHGSILVPIGPVNTAAKSFTMDFTGEKGVQQPTSYEGAEGKVSVRPTMSLISEAYYEGSLGDSLTLGTTLPLEIAG